MNHKTNQCHIIAEVSGSNPLPPTITSVINEELPLPKLITQQHSLTLSEFYNYAMTVPNNQQIHCHLARSSLPHALFVYKQSELFTTQYSPLSLRRRYFLLLFKPICKLHSRTSQLFKRLVPEQRQA